MNVNGRVVDTSCPYMSQCWGNQGCVDECPPTLIDVLTNSARLEHELGMLPHTDPDLAVLCPLEHDD